MVVNVGGAARPDVPGVPGLLPRDVPAFTGRSQELARLTALAGGGRVVVSAIGGTAGVGKTALAVHASMTCSPSTRPHWPPLAVPGTAPPRAWP